MTGIREELKDWKPTYCDSDMLSANEKEAAVHAVLNELDMEVSGELNGALHALFSLQASAMLMHLDYQKLQDAGCIEAEQSLQHLMSHALDTQEHIANVLVLDYIEYTKLQIEEGVIAPDELYKLADMISTTADKLDGVMCVLCTAPVPAPIMPDMVAMMNSQKGAIINKIVLGLSQPTIERLNTKRAAH